MAPRSTSRPRRATPTPSPRRPATARCTSSQTFTIAVTDVAPSTPIDSDAAANTVAEGAANGSTVGVTASSTDINGPAVTYSLTGDTSGGGFTINAATGVVTVADSTKIDYESAPGHAYTVTAQASDGTQHQFADLHHRRHRRRAVDAGRQRCRRQHGRRRRGQRLDRRRHRVLHRRQRPGRHLVADHRYFRRRLHHQCHDRRRHRRRSTKIDFESSGGSYTVTAQASDGTLTSSQAFVIAVTDVAPSTPVDSDAATNQVVDQRAGRHLCRRDRVLDRRQRPGGDLFAGRRHLGRRLHHQFRNRRRHGRRPSKIIFTSRAVRPTTSRWIPATARCTASRPSPSM